MDNKPTDDHSAEETSGGYRRSSLIILLSLLSIWFVVSFGCGILLRDWMDANMPPVGHAKFGFWMAQQGSIICFVFILIAYALLMGKLDEKHGYSETSNKKEAK